MRYNTSQSSAMADVFRSQTRTDNHWYDYTFNVYAPDTFALVYDANSLEYCYADRLTVEQALDFWQDYGPMIEAFQSEVAKQRQYADLYRDRERAARERVRTAENETENATDALSSVVTFLGDVARKHSIDNSLCENYERFLDNVVKREANVPERNDLRTNDFYKSALRTFYVNATRTRAASLTVGVNASGFTTGDGRTTVTSRQDYEVVNENSTIPLTFDMAERANKYAADNGWTRGHYAFNQIESEETNDYPENPEDGDTYNDRTYCSMCDAWHEN